MPENPTRMMDRRDLLKGGAATAAGLMLLGLADAAFPGEGEDEEWIPFLNAPRATPGQLDWEGLDTWITPQEQVFGVAHYGNPEVPDDENYRLDITGLVERPQQLSLEAIKALPREDRLMTLECSGNGVSPGFMAAIFNSKWTGTPLGPVLESAGLKPEAKEIVFYGFDKNEETIQHRGQPVKFPHYFGRSMPVEAAMDPKVLLVYQRNGKPLTRGNGHPLRLLVPGQYGISNVKWLRKIEVRDRRYMGQFMARNYVTLRGERRGDEIVYVQTSVGKMNLKSMVARVTRKKNKDAKDSVKVYGAVWNNDAEQIKRVEISIDGGKWAPATLDAQPRSQYSWIFFSYEWKDATPGKHTVVSRAIDSNGRIQPTADDDEIALKKTYWEANEQVVREFEV